jgi:2-iminobutanoate/2-iminopropanoate deaminase
VLTEAGSGLEAVVKVTVYLGNMDDFAVMNEAYQSLFPDPKPVSLEHILS